MQVALLVEAKLCTKHRIGHSNPIEGVVDLRGSTENVQLSPMRAPQPSETPLLCRYDRFFFFQTPRTF